MYEEGTPLYHLLEQGKIEDLDEETYIKMFDLLVKRMHAAGYEHYEISNFARPGMRSRHNSSYWNDVPYIGIGASAHSYNGHRREWNVSDLEQYIVSINQGVIPSKYEEIDPVTHYNDLVTTRLRTVEGIDLRQLHEEMGDNYYDYLIDNAFTSLESGLLKIENGHLHLTLEGIHVSDLVMSDLVFVSSTSKP
jgi:oxygen-independent coproporphyrinogen-3 oxidase